MKTGTCPAGGENKKRARLVGHQAGSHPLGDLMSPQIREFQNVPDTQHDIVVDKVKVVLCKKMMQQQQEDRRIEEILH